MSTISTHDYDGVSAKLHNDDALAFLNGLESETVDLLVTSPPYFVGKEYDVSRSVDDFVLELQRVLPAMVSSLRPGGSLCFQIGNHVAGGVLTPLDALVIGALARHPELNLRNRIIWTFNHGTNASTRFSGRHETVLWYSKGSGYHFDLDASRVPQLYPGKKHYKGPKKGEWSGNPLGKNPGDVWDIGDVWGIPNVKAKHIEKTDHPCQFPTALVRRLIVGLSPRNGVVVDPYVGSGTAALASLIEGRNFEGCDLEAKYIEIAKARLSSLADGRANVREDLPVRTPIPTEGVAQLPPHFSWAQRS